MAAGIGVDFGAVQRQRAHLQHAHLTRQQQHFDERHLNQQEERRRNVAIVS